MCFPQIRSFRNAIKLPLKLEILDYFLSYSKWVMTEYLRDCEFVSNIRFLYTKLIVLPKQVSVRVTTIDKYQGPAVFVIIPSEI